MTVPAAKAVRFPVLQRVVFWVRENSLSFYAFGLTVLLGLIALAPSIIIQVPAGHVGVLWLRFGGGTVTDHVLGEGVHLILPWDIVINYDARLHNETRLYDAVAANGMAMKVEVALRYRLNAPAAGLLHKVAGPKYAETLVYPKVASLVYEFVSKTNPETFYSGERTAIQAVLLNSTRDAFAVPPPDALPSADEERPAGDAPGLVRIEDVMVSAVTLPDLVRQAIDRKIEQQQVMQEYDFRIAREEKERERKRIEAEGIRNFQDTVGRNITPEYLRLRGIEATRAFADSTNAKTIIIGGHDGLPVILNTGDDTKPAAEPAPALPIGEAAGPPLPQPQ